MKDDDKFSRSGWRQTGLIRPLKQQLPNPTAPFCRFGTTTAVRHPGGIRKRPGQNAGQQQPRAPGPAGPEEKPRSTNTRLNSYTENKKLRTIGIDIGSTTTKIAVLENDQLLYTEIVPTGYNVDKAWRELLAATLENLRLRESEIDRLVATGYGRNSVDIADRRITEIMCHAAGIVYSRPGTRSVIDIGGQDSKFIQLDADGNVADFKMNDKCAAGTGRFLEVMARALELNLEDFGRLSLVANRAVKISSMCTVFAESEVISLISRGEERENIIAGIHESIAGRVVSMMGRSGVKAPVAMTGGVARNQGIRKALEEKLKLNITVPETAQVNGAVGAAVLARKI